MVLEVAPRRIDSRGDSCGERKKSGEEALREPFGGVGVGFPLLRLNQLAQLGVFFVSQGFVEGVLTAV